jgi:hypothetical protein
MFQSANEWLLSFLENYDIAKSKIIIALLAINATEHFGKKATSMPLSL